MLHGHSFHSVSRCPNQGHRTSKKFDRTATLDRGQGRREITLSKNEAEVFAGTAAARISFSAGVIITAWVAVIGERTADRGVAEVIGTHIVIEAGQACSTHAVALGAAIF